MRADYYSTVYGHSLQYDHLPEPPQPSEAGRRRHGGAPVLPSGQGQMQRGPEILPLYDVRARVHRSRTRTTSLPTPLPIGEDGLRELDEQVRLQMAGDTRLRTVSRRRSVRGRESDGVHPHAATVDPRHERRPLDAAQLQVPLSESDAGDDQGLDRLLAYVRQRNSGAVLVPLQRGSR